MQLYLNLLNCTFLKMSRVSCIIWKRVLNSVAQLCVGAWWWWWCYWWHIACPYSLMWSMWQQNPINEVYKIKHSPPMSFKIGSNKAEEYCYYATQLWHSLYPIINPVEHSFPTRRSSDLFMINWLKLCVNRCIHTYVKEKFNKFHYIDKK